MSRISRTDFKGVGFVLLGGLRLAELCLACRVLQKI